MTQPLILIVEDEEQYLKALQAALENQFKLLCAKTGEEAIAHFKVHKGKIKLAILDYNLPDFCATEVVKQMDNISYKDIPDIIIATAYDDPQTIIESMTTGLAFEYITKPYDKVQLISVIQKTLNKQKNEFEQKNRFLTKNDYINEKMTELKITQFENMALRFGEAIAKEQMAPFFRQVKTARKNIPLSVTLRILEDETGEVAPLPRVAKILVIEDEEPMRQALKIMLEERFIVYLASTGQEGLDKMATIPDLDIVILDIGLPDIKGDEILRRMNDTKSSDSREIILKGPDVVVLTAFSDEETIKQLCRDGATHYITKGEGKQVVLDILKKIAEDRYYFKTIPQLLTILHSQTPSFKTRLMHLNNKIKEQQSFSRLSMADIYRYFPDYQCKAYAPELDIPKLTLETGLREFVVLLKERSIEEKSQELDRVIETIQLSDLQLNDSNDDDMSLYSTITDSDLKNFGSMMLIFATDTARHSMFRTLFSDFTDLSIFTDFELMMAFMKEHYGHVAVLLVSDNQMRSFQKVVETCAQISHLSASDPARNNRIRIYILSDEISLDNQYLLMNKRIIEMCFSTNPNQKELVKAVKNSLKEKIWAEQEAKMIRSIVRIDDQSL